MSRPTIEFPSFIPFGRLLGLQLLRYESGECEILLTPKPELLNSWNVVHGGATMTLLDVCMAHAARSDTPGAGDDVRAAATIEMKTSFVRPGVGPLTCRSKVLHRTSTMAFVEGRVEDEKGALVAHGTGTFKYLRAMPVAGERRVMPLNDATTPGASE